MTTIEDYVVRCAELERERDDWKASHDTLIGVIMRLYREMDQLYTLHEAQMKELRRLMEAL